MMPMKLRKSIENALTSAARILPPEVEERIRKAEKCESGEYGKTVLTHIVKNIDISRESGIPLCQDTGMFFVLVSIGRKARVNLPLLEEEINAGARAAAKNSLYRKSVVRDPLYDRSNTGNNLPCVIYYEMCDGENITISFLLKGFGSENCSGVRMLNPTAGEDEVVEAVTDIMRSAGGKPCPPVFLGIGLGGTMDKAAFLSKKALLRSGENPDKRYRALEERIRESVNTLPIGPGGLGGDNTCLGVAIETYPTHIAGLPLAVTVNCHAERRATVVVLGGYDGEA